MKRFAAVMLVTGLGAVALSGVHAQEPAAERRATQAGLERTTTQGPLTVRISTDRTKINPAQLLHLSVRISAPEGYTVTPPQDGETLGDFTVTGRDDRPARLEAGRLVRDLTYTLEPFLAGEYTIPPLDIAYARIGGGDTGSVSTGPLTVRVVSLLPRDAKLDPGPSRTVMSPAARGSWTQTAVMAALVCACAGGTATVLLRRRRRRSVPSIADALAVLRRDAEAGTLAPREICDQGPALVRLAFAARIPGARAMTTDQLVDAAPAAGITEHELGQLREFLRACDAVRYAGEPADGAALRRALGGMVGIASFIERPAPPTKGAP